MDPARAAYDELYVYALGRGGPEFILQHVVDAYAAQTAQPGGKPMGLVFALAGLYLHLERQRTGREVQQAHLEMAREKRDWPPIPLPKERGSITAAEVLASSPGPERDQAISAWCRSVWETYAGSRQTIIGLLQGYGIH